MHPTLRFVASLATASLLAGPAAAACERVTFANVGWTETTITTAVSKVMLVTLGYKVDIDVLGVPETYAALHAGEADVFLGNWMPAMDADLAPYRAEGTVVTLRANLRGAKYTLAANAPAAALGIADFADIAPQAAALGGRIYAIQPESDGNRLIRQMIETGAFGLGGFQIAESSEEGMVEAVRAATEAGQPAVFLGWEPHPMNAELEMTYLSGGDDWFGPDFGGASIYTNARVGLAADCPNLNRFFVNLGFSLEMVSALMSAVLLGGEDEEDAAEQWLADHAEEWEGW
ncbi:MAG: glycine betaine ABC transporter substrate-binding protein, partial [Pseudomonadota bacterium]